MSRELRPVQLRATPVHRICSVSSNLCHWSIQLEPCLRLSDYTVVLFVPGSAAGLSKVLPLYECQISCWALPAPVRETCRSLFKMLADRDRPNIFAVTKLFKLRARFRSVWFCSFERGKQVEALSLVVQARRPTLASWCNLQTCEM